MKNATVIKEEVPTVELSPPSTNTTVDDAEHAKLNPAENSYQQEKERQEKIEYDRQMDVLKKAASYAATQIGLPSDCPLACARICIPGLCKQNCCTRSKIADTEPKLPDTMPMLPPHMSAIPPVALPARYNAPVPPAPAPLPFIASVNPAKPYTNPVTGSASRLTNFAGYRPQQNIINPYNKLAYQNKMLQDKAAAAQFRAMAYANKLTNQRPGLTGPNSDVAALCPYPSPNCQNPFVPPLIHNCAPICRSSCIPTCPNECCVSK